jgi:hypothetical protein
MRIARTVHNVHSRVIAAPAAEVGALVDQLATDDDPIWPAPAWPAIRFDCPLAPGAIGGHGPVRYSVEEYEPGRRVRFRFTFPGSGYHELVVKPLEADGEGGAGERCLVQHTLETDTPGSALLAWPLALRWMHDALLEDTLDAIQYAVGEPVPAPARWSPWVRLLNRVLWDRPRATAPRLDGRLAGTALSRVDFTDAWQLRLHPSMPATPEPWAEAALRLPAVARGMMALRQAVVGLLGIRREPSMRAGFPVVARTEEELLLGVDDSHLDFRLAVLTAEETVTLTTVVKIHNRRGRLYFAVVRRIHPFMVRAMLRNAHRQLARASTPAARARAELARTQ